MNEIVFLFEKVPTLKVFFSLPYEYPLISVSSAITTSEVMSRRKTDATQQTNIDAAIGEGHLICGGCQQGEHRLIPIDRSGKKVVETYQLYTPL